MDLQQIFEPLWNSSGGEENHLVFEVGDDGIVRLHTSILSTNHHSRIRLPLCLHADMSTFYQKTGMGPFFQRIQWCSEQNRTVEYVSESAWGRDDCYSQIRMVPYQCVETRYVRVSIKMLENRAYLEQIEQRIQPFEYEMISNFEDPLCLFDTDENGELICVVANEPFGRIFGHTSRRMYMTPTKKLFAGPTSLRLVQNAQQCIQQCKPFFYEVRFDQNQQERYWHVRFTPFFGKTQICALCIVHEITQKVMLCKQISELEQEYDCFFHMTTGGVAVMQRGRDGQYHVQKCNELFETFLEQYRQTYDQEQDFVQWMESISQNESWTLALTCEEGKVAYYKLCAEPHIVDGQIAKVFVTVVPTTQMMKLEQQMRAKLTPREAEVLALVVEGNTNRYIAHKLMVTEGTIKRIVSNGYRKLGIASRAELVRCFLSGQHTQIAEI